MANIIEEFLDKRDYEYKKTDDTNETVHALNLRCEQYIIDKSETLDGLKLRILVKTMYNGDYPMAQDFTIVSNRGVTVSATVGDLFEKLRMFL